MPSDSDDDRYEVARRVVGLASWLILLLFVAVVLAHRTPSLDWQVTANVIVAVWIVVRLVALRIDYVRGEQLLRDLL